MSKPFDPRKILKHIRNDLLRPFFDLHGGLEGVAWNGLGDTDMGTVFAAWQKMPDDKREIVQVVLQDINELADDRGVKVLVEEIQRSAPQRLAECHAYPGKADRAMWTYLNARTAFNWAAHFARADALSSGRYWIKRNTLPKNAIAVTDAHKAALQQALTGFYWSTQMRGRFCVVEHYQRTNGSEYFFAYLEDYPDAPAVFENDGQVVRREERRAFDNVFVFNPGDGSLEMFAPGGKAVYEPLQKAFCKAVMGLDVGPADPLRPAYSLDHLLKPGRAMPTDPGDRIAEVKITRARLQVVDRPAEYVELGIDRRGGGGLDRAIQEYLNTARLPLDRLRVRQMSFQLVFAGNARARSVSFSVSCPNSCDLKSRPDAQRAIGERCLRLWEVTK
ncbi:MAG: hypothetical protein KF699_10495 [Phycisphaeraceae bacterium]|nr:hypothetical protein [Phycisphaeraceae bacterium]